MPRYVIERDFPGAGKLSRDELKDISSKSCEVLKEMGPEVQWIESYVADDKVYCVYYARDEELVREHSRRGGFPVTRVSRVQSVIDPATAEEEVAPQRVAQAA